MGLSPAAGGGSVEFERTRDVAGRARFGKRASVPNATRRLKPPPEGDGRRPRFGAELFPRRSLLPGESSLVFFPPLTDMLKFSG